MARVTPICERESPPHKRRRGGRKKPYKLEGRYVGPRHGLWNNWRQWHVIGSYETERGRESALAAHRHGFWGKEFEYRLAAINERAA